MTHQPPSRSYGLEGAGVRAECAARPPVTATMPRSRGSVDYLAGNALLPRPAETLLRLKIHFV
ncbi:hypothetical protein ABZX62_07075 [Streptomyces flavidovirens]|uniref:hypothetical protein n=1 Tax=Streptomyces flavidovirens TaxID=67298 RepID=UPI0033BAA53A